MALTECHKCWNHHCTCNSPTHQPNDAPCKDWLMTYKDEYEKLQSICLRIYYARIAMREDLVIKGLEDIDEYFREPNMN